MTKTCSEPDCTKTIHPERLAALPRAVTCSTECSALRTKRRKAKHAAAVHKRTGYAAARKSYRKARGLD